MSLLPFPIIGAVLTSCIYINIFLWSSSAILKQIFQSSWLDGHRFSSDNLWCTQTKFLFWNPHMKIHTIYLPKRHYIGKIYSSSVPSPNGNTKALASCARWMIELRDVAKSTMKEHPSSNSPYGRHKSYLIFFCCAELLAKVSLRNIIILQWPTFWVVKGLLEFDISSTRNKELKWTVGKCI